MNTVTLRFSKEKVSCQSFVPAAFLKHVYINVMLITSLSGFLQYLYCRM